MRVAAGSFQNGLWMPRSCLWHWPRILISTPSDAYPIVWFSYRVWQEARSTDTAVLACDFSLKINSYTALSFDLLLSLRMHSCMYLTYNCTSSTRQLPVDEKNVGIRWRTCMIGWGIRLLHLAFKFHQIRYTVIVLPVVTITWIIRGKKRHAFPNQWCDDSIDIIHIVRFTCMIVTIVIFRMRWNCKSGPEGTWRRQLPLKMQSRQFEVLSLQTASASRQQLPDHFDH